MLPDSSRETAALISETFLSFFKRASSAIAQTILYSAIVLGLFSWIFAKPFVWIQFGALIWGSFVVVVGTFLALKGVIPTVMVFQQESQGITIADGFRSVYLRSARMAFFMVLSLFFGCFTTFIFVGGDTLAGFAVGVMIAGFFLRIGGNLYQATTDIGADVMAGLELNLPHEDPRNPLTLLDLSGQFIGSIVGFAADLALSLSLAVLTCVFFSQPWMSNLGQMSDREMLSLLPFQILGIGLVSCLLGVGFSYFRSYYKKIHNILLEGVYVATIFCGVFTWLLMSHLQLSLPNFHPFFAYSLGLLGAVFFGFGFEYMTSVFYGPVKKLASMAEYGPTLMFLSSLGTGKKSQAFFLLSLLLVVVPSYMLAGVYGVGLTTLGMLSVKAIILCVEYFSSILQVLTKLSLMIPQSDNYLKRLKKLDKIGHTTIALGEGFAAGASLVGTVGVLLMILIYFHLHGLLVLELKFLAALFVGVALPPSFSGFLISGLCRGIKATGVELRRQFKEIPFLKEGKAKPDMKKASDTVSRFAMDALILPAVIMVLVPIVIGYSFGMELLLGLTLGTVLQAFATGFSNLITGGLLHSAKNYIASGAFGGKTSHGYGSATIADNIAQSFSHLIGPSLMMVMRGIIVIVLLLVVIFHI